MAAGNTGPGRPVTGQGIVFPPAPGTTTGDDDFESTGDEDEAEDEAEEPGVVGRARVAVASERTSATCIVVVVFALFVVFCVVCM